MVTITIEHHQRAFAGDHGHRICDCLRTALDECMAGEREIPTRASRDQLHMAHRTTVDLSGARARFAAVHDVSLSRLTREKLDELIERERALQSALDGAIPEPWHRPVEESDIDEEWERYESELMQKAVESYGVSDAETRRIARYIDAGVATLCEIDMFTDTTGFGLTG